MKQTFTFLICLFILFSYGNNEKYNNVSKTNTTAISTFFAPPDAPPNAPAIIGAPICKVTTEVILSSSGDPAMTVRAVVVERGKDQNNSANWIASGIGLRTIPAGNPTGHALGETVSITTTNTLIHSTDYDLYIRVENVDGISWSPVTMFTTNPDIDTDNDGTSNCADVDDDNDGDPDLLEIFCGSDPLDSSITCATLNVEENLPLSKHLLLYPNPSKEIVNIKIINGIKIKEVTVYSYLGKRILTTDKTTFNVSNLNKGLYLVKIESSKGSAIKKLIVQ